MEENETSLKTNIYMYKIGYDLYKNREDKNCGLFEYNKIKEEVEKSDVNSGTLFIVNGLLGENEYEYLIRYMKNFDRKNIVFILTDLSLLKNNIDVINKCGTLLHSSKDENFCKNIINVDKSFYSGIPDLYYDENREKSLIKSDIIVFGGSFGNSIIEDKAVKKLVLDDDYNVINNMLFMFKTNDEDHRISYENYLKILDLSSFTLCVKRNAFLNARWVTPRLLDAISCYSFPIVEKEYDVEYNYPKQYSCENADDVEKVFDYFKHNKNERNDIINVLRKEALERKKIFCKIISEL